MPTTKRRSNCFSNNLRPMFDLGNEVRFLGRLILKRLSVWFCSPLRSVGHNLLHHRLLLTKVHKHTQKHTKHKNTKTQHKNTQTPKHKNTLTPNTQTQIIPIKRGLNTPAQAGRCTRWQPPETNRRRPVVCITECP